MSNPLTSRPRSVLRYYGGKFKLAQWIVSHFPPHRAYTEAFGGGASVLMRKPRSYSEVYNDLDGEICNLFRVLRDPAQARELHRLLTLTPFARGEFESSYLNSPDPIEQARRTLVRSFMGCGADAAFGRTSGFRGNVRRKGTLPPHGWATYPAALDSFTARLRCVIVENRPALDVLRAHDRPDTLHYVDPPYHPSTRSMKHRYRFELSESEHIELAEALHECEGMVCLSGYRCDAYDALYVDWFRVEKETMADGARPRVEVLWLNQAACGALAQPLLPLLDTTGKESIAS